MCFGCQDSHTHTQNPTGCENVYFLYNKTLKEQGGFPIWSKIIQQSKKLRLTWGFYCGWGAAGSRVPTWAGYCMVRVFYLRQRSLPRHGRRGWCTLEVGHEKEVRYFSGCNKKILENFVQGNYVTGFTCIKAVNWKWNVGNKSKSRDIIWEDYIAIQVMFTKQIAVKLVGRC